MARWMRLSELVPTLEHDWIPSHQNRSAERSAAITERLFNTGACQFQQMTKVETPLYIIDIQYYIYVAVQFTNQMEVKVLEGEIFF